MAAKRKKLKVGNYYRPRRVGAFSSGCTPLDMVLGPGGWAENRIANIVGDKSTGKTLLLIEACANFRAKHPKGRVILIEAEAAFDRDYAESLGFPSDAELIEDVFTVEALARRLAEYAESTVPTLVGVDSLDALSDEAELGREMGQGTYGTGKAKGLSEMFRRLVKIMANGKLTLICVSQIRDNIGVTFGKKHTRSGGHALDFYCSQVVWLRHLKRLDRTRKGVKREVGVRVSAKCEKNKVGYPFRECTFNLYFGYGTEDVEACLDWLLEHKQTGRVYGTVDEAKQDRKNVAKLAVEEYRELLEEVRKAVRAGWSEIDKAFAVDRRKYL